MQRGRARVVVEAHLSNAFHLAVLGAARSAPLTSVSVLLQVMLLMKVRMIGMIAGYLEGKQQAHKGSGGQKNTRRKCNGWDRISVPLNLQESLYPLLDNLSRCTI